MDSGWICLHRKIRDNWIWDDPEKLRAWIDILLMVNHEDRQIPFEGHIITIRKGQKLTSLYKLAERWGWTRSRVNRFLNLLEEAEMATVKRTPNGTLLTVINWAFYQDRRNSNDTTDSTTDDTTGDTTDNTTGDTQTTINNNDNKGNKSVGRTRSTPTPSLEEVQAYCRERGFVHVDAVKFWNYYESKSWTEGGQLIGWRQRLAYWEAKDMTKEEKPTKKKPISADEISDIAKSVFERRSAK